MANPDFRTGEPEVKFTKYQVEDDQLPQWLINEAHLINDALDKGAVTKQEAQEGLVEDREVLEMMRKMIDVKYFVEYSVDTNKPEERGTDLLKLFQQEVTVEGVTKPLADFLAENRQGVSLAMSTLDDKTAAAVRYLNERGVPVVGWVVVEDVEGYWTNPTNVRETRAKAEQIQKWAKDHQLVLTTLGFDLEKPLEYIKALSHANVREILREMRNYRATVQERAQEGNPRHAMEQLIADLKSQGIGTEVYTMPRFLKRLLGGMDIRTADRYVEMVYSSTAPAVVRSSFANTFRSKDAIAGLGLVSGKDTETPGRNLSNGFLPPHLSAEELQRDIELVLERDLDLPNRELRVRDLYLFALNDARVALMMDAALRGAFESKAQQQ